MSEEQLVIANKVIKTTFLNYFDDVNKSLFKKEG
jgi:hypothetical protein